MNLQRAAMQGAVWSVLESVGIQLMSFVLFVVLARLIEPGAFGIIQIAITVLALLSILVEQGFAMTIVQRRELTPATLDTAFWIGLSTSTAVAVGLALCAGQIAAAYDTPELASVLRALALSLPIAATCSVPTALFIRGMAFRAQALRRLIAVLGGGVVGVGLAFAGFGVWSLVARLAVETVLDCIVVWRVTEFRPGLGVSRTDARELFSFGSRVVGSNLIGLLNRRADDLLIGYVLGPVALGYYAVACRAMLLVSEVALRAAQRTAVPVFSKLQNDPARLRSAYYTAVEFASAISCPIFLGLTATAPELCLTLLGSKWAAAIPAMQVLGLAGVGLSVSLYAGPMLIAVGKPDWFLRLNIATAVINIAASAIAVRWGLLAMACGYVLRGYLTLPLVFRAMQRAIGADSMHVLRLMFAPTFASLVMAGVVAIVRRCVSFSAPISLSLFVVVGGAVYVAMMSLLARGTIARLMTMVRLARGPRTA